MKLRYGLIAMLLLVIFSAIGYWLHENFEKRTREVEVGYLGEARINSLLAAQRFFESYGIQARSQENIARLPPTQATLVYPGARHEMGEAEAQRLRTWVKQGGHLVLLARATPEDEEVKKDVLLDPLRIHMQEIEDPESHDVVDVDWPQARDFMQVTLNRYQRLVLAQGAAQPVLALADEEGAYLLRMRHGRGYITVLSDSRFMRNFMLGRKDHALFLWHVVQVEPQAPWRSVWLIHSDGMPSLPEWLLRHAWAALLSGALLLLLWLWAASRRFGPLQPVPPLARRRLLDHIEASGRFLWRAGHNEQLLKGVRQNLYRLLEVRHPAWAGLSSHDLYERLAELSGLPYEKVQGALLYSQGSEHEFTQVIQTLERIRTAL